MESGHGLVRTVRLLEKLRLGTFSLFWRLEARLRGVEVSASALLNGRPCLARSPGSRIVLAEGVILNSTLRSNPLGCSRPATLRTLRPGAEIRFDRDAGISGAVVCAAASVHVGEGTIIGVDTMIFDTDFHAPEGEWRWVLASNDNPQPIRIGRGVFLGARALVLKGVTIGDRAVIGAGAVVTKDVPAWHVAVGNPARVLRLPNGPPPSER